MGVWGHGLGSHATPTEMIQFLVRRCIAVVPVLLGVTVVVFIATNLTPGDPISAMLDPSIVAGISEQAKDALRRDLGLDRPLYVRYVKWLGQLARGNLGYSMRNYQPVIQRILPAVGATSTLAIAALILSIATGVGLGVVCAVKKGKMLDRAVTFMAFFGLSVPVFVWALLLIYVFSLKLGALPPYGMGATLPARVSHALLPVLALSVPTTVYLMRHTRSEMLEVLAEDYVTVARAKGLREHVVVLRHALKNAGVVIITLLSLQLGVLFSGTVVIETIFSWPGLGFLAVRATEQRDYPVLMGVTLAIAIFRVASNLAADIAYGFADPRIRYG